VLQLEIPPMKALHKQHQVISRRSIITNLKQRLGKNKSLSLIFLSGNYIKEILATKQLF